MHKKPIIRKVLAFVMLIVFALSVTPKRYLHDLFADHVDTVTILSHEGQDSVVQDGFNCDCNSLVATSPFTDSIDQLTVTPLPAFPTPLTSFLCSEYFSTYDCTGSRGPPALG